MYRPCSGVWRRYRGRLHAVLRRKATHGKHRKAVEFKYMSKVPTDQAEYLKTNCASLYSNDTTVVAVTSQNTQNGATETLNVTSKELYDTIVEFVTQYVKVIESLLSSIPQDLQAAVKSEGVFVCGGGAKLPGLDMFLQNELGIPSALPQGRNTFPSKAQWRG